MFMAYLECVPNSWERTRDKMQYANAFPQKGDVVVFYTPEVPFSPCPWNKETLPFLRF